MSQVNTQYEPEPVESSAHLLRGVRMSPDARKLAIIHMRRAEALVDLGFRAAALGKRALRRIKGGLRAIAPAAKVAPQSPGQRWLGTGHHC
ncbi:MAG TPA: hypothetical protein VFR86_16565 [Burkholderiaceae bacterium]|nr:hypothetical protein [Burkholderiaceae bacterium]